VICRDNKAFIVIRVHPGIATPLATHRHTAHTAKHASSIKLEMLSEDWATATGERHTKFCEDRSSGSRDILVQTDRHTHRQSSWSQYSAPYRGGV